MGMLSAIAVLAEEWDDVLGRLDADQVRRLRELVAQFVAELDSDRSSDLAERIMALLMEALPVSHPVLSALMTPVDRFQDVGSVAADRAWFQLAGPLQARLAAMAPAGPVTSDSDGYHGAAQESARTEISVDIYLDTNDRLMAAKIFEAADSLMRLMGYESLFDEQIFYGSIFKRAKALAKSGLTSEELATRLVKVERALELEYLDQKQAAVDVQEAEAATKLIGSLSEVPQACLRLGSLLVVKYQDQGASVVLIRNLSQSELHALERFPEIQKNPRQALDALATAVASSDSA
jgi:hypothetical protein